jgi:hypothetical protein
MSAIVFDRNDVDRLGDLSERPRRLGGSKLLWVDLHKRSEFSVEDVAKAFDLDDETRGCLATPNEQACFNDHGRYTTSRRMRRAKTRKASCTPLSVSSARTG